LELIEQSFHWAKLTFGQLRIFLKSDRWCSRLQIKYRTIAAYKTKPKLAEHNTQGERNKVYRIREDHAFVLVARVVAGFVFEAGFALVFEAGALVAALVALTTAALAAGF